MSSQNNLRRKAPTKRSIQWKTTGRNTAGRGSRDSANNVRRISVPPEPPGVNPSPWNKLVVARIFSSGDKPLATGELQSTDVVNWLVDQIDPDMKYLPRTDTSKTDHTLVADTSKPLYFKLDSIMVWNLTGKTIALSAYDLQTGDVHKYDVSDEDYESLGSWFDSCSGNSPPRVGFRWPSSNRQKVLSNHKNTATGYGEGLRHICTILAPKSDQIMVHIHVQWRFPATGKEMLRSIIGMMEVHSAICNVEKAVKTRASIALQKKQLETADNTYKAMPSKVPVLGAANVWVLNKVIPDVGDVEEKDGEHPSSAESLELISEVEALQAQIVELGSNDELYDH